MDRAKERLLGRLEAIQNLQRSRPVMVQLFDRLVNEIPEEVYLQNFRSRDDEITMQGTARSNPLVSNFMRRLGDEAMLNDPELLVIENESINGVRASEFELMVRKAKPEDTADEADEKG
jgi:type IV pilus assembly protein PilN